jgi:hypothetical protein
MIYTINTALLLFNMETGDEGSLIERTMNLDPKIKEKVEKLTGLRG